METETTTPAGQPIVSREKTSPFLIRTFIKIGNFHRLSLFEDGNLPTADEQQIFTWKDATLREVLTTIRNTAPHTPEYRHPLARYSFRAVYVDSASRGRYFQKELGTVYSRDILGEPGSLQSPAPRLLEDAEGEEGSAPRELTDREKEERTLEELRFVPGDYLCVAVILPKNVTVAGPTGDLTLKGSATGGGGSGPAASPVTPASNGWRNAGPGGAGARSGDGGWGSSFTPSGRGGGHWRGESNAPSQPSGVGRGRGGRGEVAHAARDRDLDRPRENDRWVPPPRRGDSPPPRGGWGDRERRGGRGERRSRSRSRTPPRRRNSRYD